MPVAPALIGTYSAPAVKHGERVACLYRDCDCKVTSISNAPIPWPRVRSLEGNGGGSGLWVNDALVEAIRTESAVALKFWFGVTAGVVWKWRKAFGVGGHGNTTGSKRAIRAAKRGAEAMKAKEWTDAELDAKAVIAKRFGTHPGVRWTPARGGWTPEQLTLLGTDHDKVIAQKLGRTRSAVTTQRTARKIPAFSGNPCRYPGWTAEEVALLGTDHDEVVAARIGRTVSAVEQKREGLRIAPFRDRRHG